MIDATGKLVTPASSMCTRTMTTRSRGTRLLMPSSWHGVPRSSWATVSLGFRPTDDKTTGSSASWKASRTSPGAALAAGIRWGWETFPEFLDYSTSNRWRSTSAPRCRTAPCWRYVMGARVAQRARDLR